MINQIKIFTSPQCSACQALKRHLDHLIELNKIEAYHRVDISEDASAAQTLGIRSVPCIFINDFVFIGLLTEAEILHWLSKGQTSSAVHDYFSWLLPKGELNAVEIAIKAQPSLLAETIPLLLNAKTSLQIRIGLMAIVESYQNSDLLKSLYHQFIEGKKHEDFRIRTDITQVLLFSNHQNALSDLTDLTKDEHPEVREAAKDALEDLHELSEHSSPIH